jgi:restriction system protein
MGGSGTIQEIMEHVLEIADFSEEQQSILHNDGPGTEIAYRLAWGRSYLKKVDALENSQRGVWAITSYGRTLTESDMSAIPAKIRAMSPSKSRTPRGIQGLMADDPAISEKILREQSPQISSTVFVEWRDALLNVLLNMHPSGFERLCRRLLLESGFTKVDVTGRSGDGGIDGIGVLRISLLSFQVFFQCKRYKGSVPAGDVRNFRGAMVGRTDKGLLITTGTFTSDAKREATRDGAPVIDLIDGDDLCEKLKDLKLGVSTQQVEEVSINPHWFEEI